MRVTKRTSQEFGDERGEIILAGRNEIRRVVGVSLAVIECDDPLPS